MQVYREAVVIEGERRGGGDGGMDKAICGKERERGERETEREREPELRRQS